MTRSSLFIPSPWEWLSAYIDRYVNSLVYNVDSFQRALVISP
jgi:hypothetical protein